VVVAQLFGDGGQPAVQILGSVSTVGAQWGVGGGAAALLLGWASGDEGGDELVEQMRP